jgi:hypothetical protein
MGLVKEPMERSTITMEPADWAVVYQIAKDMGLSSRSAGVRFIIRDWQRLKAAAEYKARPHAPAIRVPATVVQPEEA